MSFSRWINKLQYTHTCTRACVLSLSVDLTLYDPKDCSFLSSSVHGILQARILEWVVMPFSRGTSQPRNRTHTSMSSALVNEFFTTEPPGKQCIQTAGYYSELKRNKLSSHEKIWRKLKWILLSESSQSKKLFSIWHSGKSKTIGTVRRSVVARGWSVRQGWVA